MRAGFGAATITPELPVFMAGFGARSEPAAAIRDSLEARALVLEDRGTALCLVVCDLLGMTPDFSTPIRRRIAGELGTDVGCVLVSCTHTHHGPSCLTGSEALGWPVPDGYRDLLESGCVAAALHAKERSEGAELRYARAPLPAVSFNRRGHPYASPELAVLDVVRRDGHRLGVVCNAGVHPVALGPRNLEISTDWVGPMRAELEALAGGLAVGLSGAFGDVNPLPPQGVPENTYEPWATAEATEGIGRDIARAGAEALDDASGVPDGLRVVRDEAVDVRLGDTGLARLAGDASQSVEFVEWSVGDVRVVSLPGEAFFALGREVEDARGRRTLLAGLAPAWHGYLPHPFTEGYEEGLSYGDEAVAAIRRKLLDVP